MAVFHVLKDGTKVDSVAGKVIKYDQFESLYSVITAIQERGDMKNDRTVPASKRSVENC